MRIRMGSVITERNRSVLWSQMRMADILQGRMVDIDKDTDVLAVEMDVPVVLALVRVADAARGVDVVKILKGGGESCATKRK